MSKAKKIITSALFIALLSAVSSLAWTDVKVNADTDQSIQNEPSVTINHHFAGDPLNMVVGYNDIGKSLGISYSADSGNTWADTQIPVVWTNTGDPSVASDNNGNVYACFLTYEGSWFLGKSGIFVSKSTDGGRTWSTPVAVDSLVYVSGSKVPFADKCMMTVDTNSSSTNVNNIYVGWQRDDTLGFNSDIYFARSNDGGVSFSTPLKINDNPSQTAYAEGAFPFVGADGDVYMTWYDSYFQGHEPGSLYVAKSIDGGQNFGPDIKVANFLAPPKYTYSNTGFKAKSFPSAAADPNNSENLYITYTADPDGYFDRRLDNGKAPGVPGSIPSEWPAVDRENNYVYVVWRDFRNGLRDLYFNRSSDNGKSWELGDIGPLDNGDTPGGSNAYDQQLSSYGSNVYCVWEDLRLSGGVPHVFFNRSTDNGLTWGTDMQIDGNPSATANMATIASWSNYVYVVWSDFRNGLGDIYFTSSGNGGLSFGTPQRIDLGDAAGASNAYHPLLVCAGTMVYCMWQDDRNGNSDIYLNYSNNAGASWQASSIKLNSGTGYNCSLPVRRGLAATGTFAYACWTDDRNNPGSAMDDVFFTSSTNNGVTWNADVQLNDSGVCSMPDMTIQGNKVYVAWQDNRLTGLLGADEIWFDCSFDNGATWQSPDVGPIDVGAIGLSSYAPMLAADNNYVYCTWSDGRMCGGFGSDVFFSRSADSGLSWSGEVHLNLGSWPVSLQFNHSIVVAGNAHVNVVWPDPRVHGLPNIYTNYSTDYGATWLSGMDEADVFCVRSIDGGVTWSAPITVSDDVEGYPQVLPWVLVKANGLVDITYYDFRSTPIDPQFPGAEVRLAVSQNGGVSFGASQAIQDTVVTPMTTWVGEYNGMAVLDTLLYTVFTDFEQNGNSDIYIDRCVNPQDTGCCIGTVGNVQLQGGCDPTDQTVDISDVTNMIDHLFISYTPYCCLEEVDIAPLISGGQPDQQVDIGDLTAMIDHLFINYPPMPACP